MITKNNIQECIWLDADNELSVIEQNEMHHYLQSNVEAMELWQLAKETKLQPNQNEGLKNKMNLYAIANSNATSKPIWNNTLKLAACITLLIASGIGMYQFNITSKHNMNSLVNRDIKWKDTVVNTMFVKKEMMDSVSNNNQKELKNATINLVLNKTKETPKTENISNKKMIFKAEKSLANNSKLIKNKEKHSILLSTKNVITTTDNIEMFAIHKMSIQPILKLKMDVILIKNSSKIITKKLQIPLAIAQSNHEGEESGFLHNNKAFQIFKKVNTTLAFLNNERKTIKENGLQFEFDLPNIYTKKTQ